jgi:hypothetical protein
MAIRRPAFGEAERRPAGAKPGVSPTIPPEVAESVSSRIKGGSLVYIHAGGKRCAAEGSRRAVKHSKERTGRVEGRHNACSLLYPYHRTKAVLGARGESPLESGRNSQWGSDLPVVKTDLDPIWNAGARRVGFRRRQAPRTRKARAIHPSYMPKDNP